MDARLALAAVAGFVLGVAVAVGTTCRDTTTPHDPPVSSSVPDADVALALKELRTAIEGLPSAMRDQLRGEPAAPTRQAVGEDPAATRFVAAIDRLERLLGQTDAPAVTRGRRGATESWKGPGYGTLHELVLVAQQFSMDDDEALHRDMTKAHSLWTTEDALDRYGPPARIGTAHGFHLIYDQTTFDTGKQRCWIEFTTREGWVMDVGRMCKDIR